ncbi:hypothetical protein DNTS_008157 [Danionella cerebrum]|uniref:Transforming acidic coiled-coil-containing protein C-terminal domain-containing protein n=1 Tax=Danionella cerebrum TaxID=2873325 RepID=A0A553PUV6_9TELE|nr:hypothetical protein DNTS_008157 [Danionella translucida]
MYGGHGIQDGKLHWSRTQPGLLNIMGNEISTSELPEAGGENVVLFPPQEMQSGMLNETGDKVSPQRETNGSIPTAGSQLTTVEEEQPQNQKEEEKEELEFPHDLLPSIDLDLSTELNLTWGTALSSEQEASGEKKNEAMALGGTANPLLSGLGNYTEARPPIVGLIKSSSCDGEQISEPVASLSQDNLDNTPQQEISTINHVAAQVDYELQEALNECEDEMCATGKCPIDPRVAGDQNRCLYSGLSDKKEQTKALEAKKDFDLFYEPLESYGHYSGNCDLQKSDPIVGDKGVLSFSDIIVGTNETNTLTNDLENVKDVNEDPDWSARELSKVEQLTKSDTDIEVESQQRTTLKTIQSTSEMGTSKKVIQTIQDICTLNSAQDGKNMLVENGMNVVAVAQTETGHKNIILPIATHMIPDSSENKAEILNQVIEDTSPNFNKQDGHMCHLETKINLQTNTEKQVVSGTQQQICGNIESNLKEGSNFTIQGKESGTSEQLNPEGKQLNFLPTSVPGAHLSLAVTPLTLIPHPLQGPEKHDDQDKTDGRRKSISVAETKSQDSCTTEEVKYDKHVPDASAVMIDFCKDNAVAEYDPNGRCDLETYPPKQENRAPLGNKVGTYTAVWGDSHSQIRAVAEVEEEVPSNASTLLQTTPTMPEMIGEKTRDDTTQGAVIIVHATERESTEQDADVSQSTENKLRGSTSEQGHLCRSVHFVKNCSPAQIKENTEESCVNDTPPNSTENERDGGGLPTHYLAEDRDTHTVSTENKALVTSSFSAVFGTCVSESFPSKEKQGKYEEKKTEIREGKAQSGLLESRVSQTEIESETGLFNTISASPAATQEKSDVIHPVTKGTALFPRTPFEINDCDAISSSFPLSHINSTETEAQREDEANLNLKPCASGAELPCSDLLFPLEASPELGWLVSQANSQQVPSTLQTTSANCDTSIKTGNQIKETVLASEDNSAKLTEKMRDVTGCFAEEGICQEGSQKDATLNLKMKECSSLPPLMVFENLRHPVKETSFNFEGFLSINTPALPEKAQENTENKENNLKKEVTFSEEQVEEDKKGKPRGQVDITLKDSTDWREVSSVTLEQSVNTLNLGKNVKASKDDIENSGTGIDKSSVIQRKHVTFASLYNLDNTETNDEVKENLEQTDSKQEQQRMKASVDVTLKNSNDGDESAFTENRDLLLQVLSSQESGNSSPTVDCLLAEIDASKGGQLSTEALLGNTQNQIEEDNKSKVLEANDINMCHGNSLTLVDKQGYETENDTSKHGSLDKTSSLSQSADTDINKCHSNQPAKSSEMPILSKTDADVWACQKEPQLTDSKDAGDTVALSHITVGTAISEQRSLFSATKQSNNSDSRDVSAFVLKAPSPMLSHCESISGYDIALAETVGLEELVKNDDGRFDLKADGDGDELRAHNANDLLNPAVSILENLAPSPERLLLKNSGKNAPIDVYNNTAQLDNESKGHVMEDFNLKHVEELNTSRNSVKKDADEQVKGKEKGCEKNKNWTSLENKNEERTEYKEFQFRDQDSKESYVHTIDPQPALKTQHSPNDENKQDVHFEDNLVTILADEPTNMFEKISQRMGVDDESEQECKDKHLNSKERTHISQEQDKAVIMESYDQTHKGNQTIFTPTEDSEGNVLNEAAVDLPDPLLTSRGTSEETVGFIVTQSKVSIPITDQTQPSPLNSSLEAGDIPDLSLKQIDSARFSQLQELQQQCNFTTPREAVFSDDNSSGFKSAEDDNHADAEAIKKDEKRMVFINAEANCLPNSPSEKSEIIFNDGKDVFYNAASQKEAGHVQTHNPSTCNFPVCEENQTQLAPNLSVSYSESSECLTFIEAPETKVPMISASQEHVSKHAEPTSSLLSFNVNVNRIQDLKKEEEHYSAIPCLSHHEEGLESDQDCLGSLPPENSGNIDDFLVSTAGSTKELIFQSSTSQGSNAHDLNATSMPEDRKEVKDIHVEQAIAVAVEHISYNSTPDSQSGAWRTEQLNRDLSEQFPDGTQNTEVQHTQCSEQQLHVRTCLGSENNINTKKPEDSFSNGRQEPLGNLEQIEGEDEPVENYCMDKSNESSAYVEKERMPNEKLFNQDVEAPFDKPKAEDANVVLNESKPDASLLGPETIAYLVDSLQQPYESNQQPTKSLIQTLREAATDTVLCSSTQHAEILHISHEDNDVPRQNERDTIEEEVNKLSEVAAAGMSGSDSGKVQGLHVKNRLDNQSLSGVFIPERSNTLNSSQGSDWLRALKEAASMSRNIPQHKDEATGGPTENRPFENLGSPQAELEFRTPTEDFFPPVLKDSFAPEPDDNFPPAPEDTFQLPIEESLPIFQENSFPPPPEETLPPVPEESFHPLPEESFLPVPEKNFHTAHVESFPSTPKESFPPVPEESFPPAPEESFPPAPEESFALVSGLLEEETDCRSAERSYPVPPPSASPPQPSIAPALPAYLLQDTVEFPTPPPTPPDRAPPEFQEFPPAPDPSDLPELPPDLPVFPQIQQLQLLETPARYRSSDSDGAFETPESTTPVKSASSPVSSTDPFCTRSNTASPKHTGSSAANPASESQDPSLVDSLCRSQSIVFDEDKPIAASGTYNLEHLIANDPFSESDFACDQSKRTPLTRSQSLQSGDLESPGHKSFGGTHDKPIHPRTQSFSTGTESTPGTLRRLKKPRPGSLKKKPLSRQNSNPERSSPNTLSSCSTPEEKRRGKPRPESPLQTQEKPSSSPSPTPSPAGTLHRNRIKSRVESPPPLPEENTFNPASTHPLPELPDTTPETPIIPDDELPIPLAASYKWDPDNFENIDPFRSGGSKIANSPVLGRKSDFTVVLETPVAFEEQSNPASSEVNIEKEPIKKSQSVRLEFDYSEDSGEASQTTRPPKTLGKKPGAKMPIRKPKLGIKKAPPPRTEQLDNAPISNDNDDIPIQKVSYNFDPSKWDDPNFNPFSSSSAIPNSPRLSRASQSFDTDSFDDSVSPFKTSNKIGNSPPKAASFDQSIDNENDNIVDLEDHNQNKPAKNKKKPVKSNTFRVKKSPIRTQIPDPTSQEEDSTDVNPEPSQDHATDEEKLASSSSHKLTRQEVEVEQISDPQDFQQPSDFTAFVKENRMSGQSDVTDYEIEYMEKIGSSAPPLSGKKPSLYLKLDSVTDSSKITSDMQDSEPDSPCTGSFEEMEAQISQGKSPVLPPRGTRDPFASEKSRKRESQPQSRMQSNEREGASPILVPSDPSDHPLIDRMSDSPAPLSYLEPDLAETNPTAFAQKLQRDMSSTGDSGVLKNSLYCRTGYIEGESPHLPCDMDHSLGIAREEIVMKEKEVLEWKRKYEESRREVEEMRRIVMEYEKTISEMIEKSFVSPDPITDGEHREKTVSHHTIQQLIMEKDQALADLNSVEKSLADLFRRYEKMKDVLEGFRKNEEVLKKCAQEYLSRVRKEEQRYQALKIHAEEKLDKANAEIAQVRYKAKQEQAAYQASLRKEQMKNKEIEELTKICDELIAKMGRS